MCTPTKFLIIDKEQIKELAELALKTEGRSPIRIEISQLSSGNWAIINKIENKTIFG